jgi:8-oxo-dGTP diphosphatase
MIIKGAHVLVLNEKGEILLTQRQDLEYWVFPGGRIEEGETPEETAVREVKEETGIEIKIERLATVNVIDHLLMKNIDFLFIGKQVGGQIKRQKGEVLAIKWISQSKAKSCLRPFLFQRLKASLKGNEIQLIVSREFPFPLYKLPQFFWRRTLGKKLGLVKV